MRSSILFTVSALLFIVSCSGINSEGDTAFIPDKNLLEKPRCNFKTTNNCWTKSLNLLSSCMDPQVPGEVDVFTEDKRFCSNSSGKLIEFINPLDLIDEKHIDFRVYNTKEKCFRYKGNGTSFEIDENEFGKLSVKTFENGDIQVQCFFGEKFVIPAEVVEKGCRGVAKKIGDYIPKTSLFSFQEAEDKGYQFIFMGIGGSPRPVFKCYE